MLTKEPQQTWVFDRYVNGVLMAEGVEVTRASSLEEAMIIAARLAACGPNGETPVLILCNAPDVLARAEKAEQERDRIDQWRETAIVERDTYSEERDAAEGRVAALTEALGDMVGLFSADNVLRKGTHMNATLKLARAALAPTPTKTESPGELVETLRTISMAQSLSVVQQTALKLIKDLGGQND